MEKNLRAVDFANYKQIVDNTRSKIFTAVFGMQQGQKNLLNLALEGFVVYVTTDFIQAKNTVTELNEMGGKFEFLPHLEEVLLYKKSFNVADRSTVLSKIRKREIDGIVICIESMCQYMPLKQSIEDVSICLKVNQTFTRESLINKLILQGYKSAPMIEAVGEFSVRGEIVDIFSTDNAVRIEYFNDTIEQIKLIDVNTYKSVDKLETVEIYPLNNTYLSTEEAEKTLYKINDSAKRQILKPSSRSRLVQIIDEISLDLANNIDNEFLTPFLKKSILADYLPSDSVIVWQEPKALSDRLNLYFKEFYDRFIYLLECGEVLNESINQLIKIEKVFDNFRKFAQIAHQNITQNNGFFQAKDAVKFNSSVVSNYRFNINELSIDTKAWLKNGYKVFVFAENEANAARLSEALARQGISLPTALQVDCGVNGGLILPKVFKKGFISHTNHIVIVGNEDVFIKQNANKKLTKSKSQVFLAPEVGDFVVHDFHGIGVCDGITTIETSFGKKDYIVVKYKGTDTLYVPVENSNLLSKYAGGDAAPKLSKLGGMEFEKVKARVKNNLKQMAIDLVKLYAERENARGFSYASDNYLMDEMENSFQFEATPDQLTAINDIKKDLESNKIMDRLICGDVGFGKTEVALRAAFKVICSSKQVAILAPTTILTEQHLNTCKKRFSQFDLSIECLNRFRSKKEQKDILKRLENGGVNIVIGTHRLLSADVKFQDLGLLILDEEQRFGVESKEKIKNIKKNIDVLTLSATPIPRTLHMALSGMRDISTIQTPPLDRRSVETFVIEDSDSVLRDVIMRELYRDGQIFIVYNRVETIDAFAHRIKGLINEAKIIVAHGQQNEDILEKNIYDFSHGIYNVLICTTIIENGIDMPNANTLIVYDADKLGLSQLYQLRGRVGRSNRTAFAYFIYRENKILSEVALKRLNSILTYNELGSGFKIAMKDLEIRGAGNVLGSEQHGHMEKVGYDLYARLLSESISELKGEVVEKTIETTLDVDLDAYVSEKYIADNASRMTFYQKAASVESIDEVKSLLNEITDIYGEAPHEVINLLRIAMLKMLAKKVGVSEIVIKPNSSYLIFADKKYLQRKVVFEVIEKYKNYLKLNVTDKIYITINVKKLDSSKILKLMTEILKDIQLL